MQVFTLSMMRDNTSVDVTVKELRGSTGEDPFVHRFVPDKGDRPHYIQITYSKTRKYAGGVVIHDDKVIVENADGDSIATLKIQDLRLTFKMPNGTRLENPTDI